LLTERNLSTQNIPTLLYLNASCIFNIHYQYALSGIPNDIFDSLH